MQRVKVSLLCLLSLSLAGVLVAQTAVNPNADVGSASLQDFSGGATLRGTYFDVRHMSGSGVGYQNGYSQIGAFTPFWLNEDAFIAPNTRLLLTDNSGVGVNAGLIARRYDSGRDRIWGVNGYYDSDVTKFGNRYNQLGIGVESLGQFFDIRANGYLPTGVDKTIIAPVGLSNTPFFFENRIGFIGTRLMEQALRGGDIEAGVPVTPQTPWLRAFAGGYAYQQDGGKDPVGVRARLEAWVSNDLSLGVTTTWDRQFGSNVNFVADWRFSGFVPTRYYPQWTTRERMLMPVQRQWRITAGNYNEQVNILAFNPRDNQPYFVVWVDNSKVAPGDGTFEHPFTTLPNTVPNTVPDKTTDLVLVRRGNTTEAAPLNGSITLPDFARMLGEGKPHIFDAYGDFGPFHVAINDQVLPDAAFNAAANANRYPFLTNTNAGLNGGDIIRVGSHNEVSAFVLGGATGTAISGNNVAGFHLNNLELANNIGGGIRLQNATGTGPVTLDGQTINGGVITNINRNPVAGWSFAGTGLGDNALGGIFVDTGAAGLNLAVTNVAMNANPASQLFGINLQAGNGPLTTTLTNVQTDGIAPGLGNTTAGIILGETGQALTATLTNVSAINNTGDGLQVTGTGTGSILATITDSVPRSVFNGNGGSGIVYSQTGGTGTLDMTNIQANNNGLDGLTLFGSGATTVMNANVHNSFLTGNTRDGIHVDEVLGATINLLVDPTDVSGNTRDGLFFNVAGASRLNATFLDTNLSDNLRNAINGTATGGSTVNLSLTRSPGDRSGQDGFVFGVDASTLNVTAVDSSFRNSGVGGVLGNGIVGNITTGGLATFNFTNTPVSGNRDNGMLVSASGLSNFQGTFTNSPFDANGIATAGDGIRLNLDNSDSSPLLPNSFLNLLGTTTASGNGDDGIDLNASTNTILTTNFVGTQINNNGQTANTGAGVKVNVATGANVTQNFTDVTISNLAGATQAFGYDFTVGSGGNLSSIFTVTPLTGVGSLSGNNTSAVRGVVTGNGVAGATTANVVLNGIAANSSGGIGANLTATNAGLLEFHALNSTSISRSGLAGISVLSSGVNSIVNLELNTATINGNGTTGAGSGVFAQVNTGGTLNACLDTSSVSGNFDRGIDVSVTGLNSIARFGVKNSTIGSGAGGLLGNGTEGLLANVSNNGTLLYRSIGSTYNGNGSRNGLLPPGGAGVSVTAIGTGAADTATALLLFSRDPLLLTGNTFTGNDGDGLFFNAQAGATLTASLDGITATGNDGFGVNFNASGGATKANLLLTQTTGTNTLTGNTSGPINFNIGAINSTVISLTGSFNNSAGDGIFIDLNGVTNAVVAIQGPGTINNSGQAPFAGPAGNGDGIDVRMTNIMNGSILISGLTSITTSAADGIHLELASVTNGAIRINGTTAGTNTTIGGSGGDGIDISLVNTNLVDNLNTTLGTLSVNTLTLASNVATPLNNCLPLPVTTTLNALGLVPTQALTINAMSIASSTGQGINIHSPVTSNSTIVTATFSNNVVVNSAGGDGVHVGLFNTPITTLNFIGNQVGNSRDNGVNFALNSSPIGALNIRNNQIGQTLGGGGSPLSDSLPLILPGFNSNTITAANVVGTLDDGSSAITPLGFGANFFGTTYNNAFVNINGNITFTGPLGTYTPFNLLTTSTPIIAPFFGDVDTNSGNPVTYGTGFVGGRPAFGVNWLGVRHFSASGGGANGLPDNTFQLIMVDRGDVAPGAFDFEYNYQQIRWESGQASGGNALGLGGSSARAGYSNGIATALELPGSAVNGALLDTGPAATSLIQNSLNSIHPGRYIFFARGGGVGGASPNGLDGILLNAQNGSHIGAMTIDSNTITSNGLNGIEVVANNSTLPGLGAPVIISNNTITSQVAGDGFRLVNPNTAGAPIGLTFRDNTISTNGGAGINVQLNAAGGANVNLNSAVGGNQITNNGSFGVHVVATDTETGPITLTVGGAGAANTFRTNVDAGLGVEFRNTAVVAHTVTVSNATFSGTTNGGDLNFNGDGLGIRLTNAAQLASLTVGSATAVNTTFGGALVADRNVGDGFTLFATDTSVVNGTALIRNVNARGNGTDGLHIDTRVNSQIADLQIVSTLAGDTIGANTLHGIQLNRIDNSTLTTLIDGVSVTGNTGDGINGFYGNAAGLQQLTIQNSQINQNTDGISLAVAANARLLATISNNTLDSNSNNGIFVTTNNTAAFGDDLLGTPSLIAGNRITDSLNRATDAADSGMRFDANNGSFQNVLVQASAVNRTVISGYGNGITVNNASSFNRVAPVPTQNTWTILGTDISANTNDGIFLNLTGSGGSVVNIGGLVAANANVTIAGTRAGAAQNGINANLTAGTNNLNIGVTDGNGATTNTVEITGMGRDGININQTGGRANVAILNTSSQFNVRRGLNIFDSATRGGLGQPQDTYVVGGGGGARDINGAAVGALGDGNIFSSNDQQGMVFDTLSTQVSNSQFLALNPFGITARDPNSTNFTFATLYAVGNAIQNSVNADGMVLSVGSNTRLNAMVSGNRISANALDDVRIFATASVNPASSTDNADTSPLTNNDIVVRDPTAHLDLVFGALDNNNDGIPETIGTASSINVGNQVNAVQFGGAGTAAITRSGVFTNADPFKNDRRVQLIGHVQIENGTGQLNNPNNNFFQLGTQQIMWGGGVFDNAGFINRPLGTAFPDTLFTPFP